jgi:hypothetical protein
MRARDWPCPFTGRPAEELHHPEGRDDEGEYFTMRFVVPVVRRIHVVEHQLWTIAGIGEGVAMDPLALQLRRDAQLLVRLGEHHARGIVVLPAETFLQLGLSLRAIADAVELRCEGRRES